MNATYTYFDEWAGLQKRKFKKLSELISYLEFLSILSNEGEEDIGSGLILQDNKPIMWYRYYGQNLTFEPYSE